MRAPPWPPEPPVQMPPARTLAVPDRGELFLRDSGGDGAPVLLLHGWMVSADLNWYGAYGDLTRAGYRVLALDHRGHGRGLRPLAPFRLADCAADAASALRTLDLAPATVVGYSMGGAIAQLVAHEHPDVVSGLVLSGTAQHWKDRETRRVWKAMGVLGLSLSLAPRLTWRAGFRRAGFRESRETVWMQSELMRHDAKDMAEAGRELGRFDSRPWLGSIQAPTAVVLTTRDEAVAPSKQRELAAALGAPVFEAPIGHLALVAEPGRYNPALLRALEAVGAREAAKVA
ncbi:MAG: alpha/beta fold hydrolase [Solirubrobacterales bacterium]|nr:alpha/beta fold hydrolase [Solirubrobacterales bacterium]MBV9473747.1 alpha/beta fold hydrolase [Solirubrobacterales bacterium]